MGGLAVAIRLAAAGHQVTIFEKNERVGGKLNLLEQQGYRWDTGPSLLTMPLVYQDLWQSAGERFEDYIELSPVEPITRYFYPDADRTVFDASDSMAAMAGAIEQLNPADVSNYFRFMGYSRRLYDLTAQAFLFNGFNSWRDWLRFNPLNSFKIDPFRTVHGAVSSFFKDPRLVQLFDRYATYNGSSPYLAPATLNIIPYVEYGLGGWYVRGGLYGLAQAYRKLVEKLGVTIYSGATYAVTQILRQARRVVGVRLANGQEHPADLVVANTDVAYTYQHLLGDVRQSQKFARLEPSCSGFVLFLGVEKQFPQLAHHNILFSPDYRREFADIFERKVPPSDPTIYICWTGKTDPQLAPAGASNLFVLVNAPYLSEAWDWKTPTATSRYRDLIVQKMEEFGLRGLNEAIAVEQVMTPLDLAQRYNAERGAIYGLSSNNRFSAFLRPPNRSPSYKGLYFVGGSTHPGGGVPLVTLSAKIVANLIKADYE
jgi:phytoene desaturase